MQALFAPLISFFIISTFLWFISVLLGLNILSQLQFVVAVVLYCVSVLATILLQLFSYSDTGEVSKSHLVYSILGQPIVYYLIVDKFHFLHIIWGMTCLNVIVYLMPVIVGGLLMLAERETPEQRFHDKYYYSLYFKSPVEDERYYNTVKKMLD